MVNKFPGPQDVSPKGFLQKGNIKTAPNKHKLYYLTFVIGKCPFKKKKMLSFHHCFYSIHLSFGPVKSLQIQPT